MHAEGKALLTKKGSVVDVEASSHGSHLSSPSIPAGHAGEPADKPSLAWTSSAFFRCLTLDSTALLACRESLRAAAEFGTIIVWFYVADRTSLIAPGSKVGCHHWLHGAGSPCFQNMQCSCGPQPPNLDNPCWE